MVAVSSSSKSKSKSTSPSSTSRSSATNNNHNNNNNNTTTTISPHSPHRSMNHWKKIVVERGLMLTIGVVVFCGFYFNHTSVSQLDYSQQQQLLSSSHPLLDKKAFITPSDEKTDRKKKKMHERLQERRNQRLLQKQQQQQQKEEREWEEEKKKKSEQNHPLTPPPPPTTNTLLTMNLSHTTNTTTTTTTTSTMIQKHNEHNEQKQLSQLQLLRNRVPTQGPTNPPTPVPTHPPTHPPTKVPVPTTTAPTPLPANPMNWRRQDPNQERVEEETATRRMQQQQQQQQQQESTRRRKKEQTEDDRLNILLLYADDWTMQVLGKLNPHVHTPNLDRMADQGMLFVNNCVTTSVCWISRATLMTGMYYSRHLQSLPHYNNMFTSEQWNDTLFPLLKNVGNYYTGIVGKWHAASDNVYMERAFHEYDKLYFGHHWINRYSTDGSMEHVTEVNRRHAIEFLQNRPKDQKFALKVSFFATHSWDGHPERSYQPMNTTRNTYYPDAPSVTNNDTTHTNKYQTILPPKTATEQAYQDLPWFLSYQNYSVARQRWVNRFEPKTWQTNIRDLYAMATEVDWAIGEIIQELDNQGITNDTLLIFTTDNGDLHGEHGLVEKWYPFEESIKVPLIIQDPRMSDEKHGSLNQEFTLNVDLAPTLLGAAHITPSSFMQGRDISELYLDRDRDMDIDTVKEEEHKNTTTTTTTTTTIYNPDADNTSSLNKTKIYGKKQQPQQQRHPPWRKDWFYEWNMGHPLNASGHREEHYIDAAFALITHEWKYIYWPQKDYEQLYHRSFDIYDEYDIIANYYIIHDHPEIWQRKEEKERIQNTSTTTTTPWGDSIQSTQEIYTTLKARFYELKDHVQYGYRI